MSQNQYDYIARVYDPIAKLVLGKSYTESKFKHLEQIKEGDKVLLLGGGTGENLAEMANRVGYSGMVYFVEASKVMMDMAWKKVPPEIRDRVIWTYENDFTWLPKEKFDVVVTQFFLDILPDKEIQNLFQELEEKTKSSSLWIFTDFFEKKEKARLLSLMMTFFKWVSNNPRKNLPDYFRYFDSFGWKEKVLTEFDSGWIKSILFSKY
ncbi:class I SAM-dependent methyltransferase [Echinicola jeungdonensis]|uniref:Class I SAM-dependent methyltransferase n=1 Tax=Echinicola jeungdonensis TaxID=709343 RepID=A0ABV5J705_9BACT|nr:class I SAM-dependent methyltransferase [Echinicola jeungdonensis]MDN3668742.1 class I SAM-dependent methyltransferase [Echinicola jeungdonensis]